MISSSFEKDLLVYLFRTPKRMNYFADRILPEHFTDQVISDIYSAYRDLYLEYRQEISTTALIHEVAKKTWADSETEYVAEILEYIIGDNGPILGPWIDEMCKQWLDERRAQMFHAKNQQAVAEGNLDAVHENYRQLVREQASSVEVADQDFFDVMEEVAKSVAESRLNLITTGLPGLNTILGGGLSRNEFGIFFGPENIGKSMMLAQIGSAAVRDGYRVLHISTEMTIKAIHQRYVARFVEIDKNILDREDTSLPRVREWQKANADRFRGNLIVRYLPEGSTANDVFSILQQAKEEGAPFDLVFIDYIDTFDYVGSGAKNMADWLKIEKIFQQFADLAKTPEDTSTGCDCCILAITHSVSSYNEKSHATHDALVRAKTSKGKVVDFSIYMGRSKKDANENRIILSCVKLRDKGAEKKKIAVNPMYAKAMFEEDELWTGEDN